MRKIFAGLFVVLGMLLFSGNVVFSADINPVVDVVTSQSVQYLSGTHNRYELVTVPTGADGERTIVINGTAYYYTPDESDAQKNKQLIDLVKTGNRALTTTTNISEAVFTYGTTYYTYDTAKLPHSLYSLTQVESTDPYNFAVSDGETTKYYRINIDTSDLKTANQISWAQVADASGARTVTVKLPNGDTRYYQYTYNKPTDYTETSERLTDITASNVKNKKFTTYNTTYSGGAINNVNKGTAESHVDIKSDFINNKAGNSANGGAIYNQANTNGTVDTSVIGDIQGVFAGNYAGNYGGAIGNYSYSSGTAVVGDIFGDFVANYAGNYGGAIGNYSYTGTAKFGNISGNFIGNYTEKSSSNGGAIWNYAYNTTSASTSEIGDITGSFVGNYSIASGGAIVNYAHASGNYAIIGNITGDFIGNHGGTTSSSYGGAIYNRAYNSGSRAAIAGITGDFISNYAYSGGAIYSYSYGGTSQIGEIRGNFIANYSVYDGGAIYNYTGAGPSTIEKLVSDFVGNYAGNYGGAIYNYSYNSATASLTIQDSSFIGNAAKKSGGAIYNNLNGGDKTKAVVNIIADEKDVVFRENYTGDVSRDSDGNIVVGSTATKNDVYNVGTVNLQAKEGREISFDGSIDGSGNLNIGSSDSSVGATGTVRFNSGVTQTNINLNSGTIKIYNGAYLNPLAFNINGGAIDLRDNLTVGTTLKKLNLNTNLNLSIDADLGSSAIDTITCGGQSFVPTATGEYSIVLSAIYLMSDATSYNFDIQFVTDDNLKSWVSIAGGSLEVENTATGYNYTVTYDSETGKLLFAMDSLYNTLKKSDPEREYIMHRDEVVFRDLSSMEGSGSTLTVDGGNYSVIGNGHTGITVGNGKTLNIQNVGAYTTDPDTGAITVTKDGWTGFGYRLFYNSQGTLKITDTVINNNTITTSSYIDGGLVYNYYGTITTLSGAMSENEITSTNSYIQGGLVRNYSGTITTLSSAMTNNTISATNNGIYGGLIRNESGTITTLSSAMTNNTITANSYIQGGLVYNNNSGTITTLSSAISGNYASSGTYIQGGMILNSSTISSLTGDITGNYSVSGAVSNTNNKGGLIYNGGFNLTIKDADIKNNATNISTSIWNQGTMNIVADSDNVDISNNKVGATITRDAETGVVTVTGGTDHSIYNSATLNLQAKGAVGETPARTITFSGTITDAATPTGTMNVGGTYEEDETVKTYDGTVTFNGAVTQKAVNINSGTANFNSTVTTSGTSNAVNVNAGTAKFSGAVTSTNLNLNGGTLALNGVGLDTVGTFTAADGTTLSTQNGSTSATNLGNLVLNGIMNLAMDADLSGTGSVDSFSATDVSGTGSININSIKILNDLTGVTPITIGVFSENLRDKITLAATTVSGVDPDISYQVSYTDTTGELTFGFGGLYGAVKSTDSERVYNMAEDEDVQMDLGAMGGVDATLTINGGNYTVQGNAHEGITVGAGQTLNVDGVGAYTVDGETGAVTVTKDGWKGFNRAFVNNGSLKLTNSTVVGNKVETPSSAYAAVIAQGAGGNVSEITNVVFKDNYAYSTGANANGSIIDNFGGTVGDITGSYFIGNYAKSTASYVYGGVFSNNNTGTFNDIVGTFSGNYVQTTADNSNANGGVLDNGGTVGDISGTFTNNSAYVNENTAGDGKATSVAYGGVISNSGTIDSVSGTFTGNYSESSGKYTYGGVISNSGTGLIKNIDGTFTNNYTKSTVDGVTGGVIDNSGTINNIGANSNTKFEGNTAQAGNFRAWGGAIDNIGTIGNIGSSTYTLSFISNGAIATVGEAKGGAIYNQSSMGNIGTASKIASFTTNYAKGTAYVEGGAIANYVTGTYNVYGNFSGNYAESSASMARGGAVFAGVGSNISLVDSTFENNYVKGNTYALGGAVYNDGTVSIIADAKNVSFTGNYSQVGEGTKISNDIYNEGTLNLQAKEGKTITFAGTITDAATPTGTTTIGGTYMDGTDEKAYSGTVNFNGTVTQKAINVSSGTVNFNGDVDVINGVNVTGGEVNYYGELTSYDFVINDGEALYDDAVSITNSFTITDGSAVFNNTLTTPTINIGVVNQTPEPYVSFSDTVTATTINLNHGTVHLGAEGVIAGVSKFAVNGCTLDTITGAIENQNIASELELNNDLYWDMEAALLSTATVGADTLDTTTLTPVAGKTIQLQTIKVIATANKRYTKTYISDATLKDIFALKTGYTITKADGVTGTYTVVLDKDDNGAFLTFKNALVSNFVSDVRENEGTTLSPGTITLTADVNVADDIAELGETDNTTSIGTMGGTGLTINGANKSVNGAGKGGITVAAGQTLNINNVGSLDTAGNVVKSWNGATSVNGGAVYNAGTLNVDTSVFSSNTTTNSSGAIYNRQTANIEDSVFYSNSSKDGGAIYNSAGTLTVTGSTFKSNTASNVGGAIYNKATANVGGTFVSNSANNDGGAIYNSAGTLTVTGSSFTSNTSTNAGGAIYNKATANVTGNFTNNTANNGGAIFNIGGTLTVTNSSFTSNASNTDGGAIYSYQESVSISGSSFTGNYAGHNGGAIRNYANNGETSVITITDTSFTGNAAVDQGGAIANSVFGTGVSTVNIIADTTDVAFLNNYTGNVSRDPDGTINVGTNATLYDVYNSGNLNIKAKANKAVTFNGKISNSATNMGDMTIGDTGYTGTVTFGGAVTQNKINVNNGTANFNAAVTTGGTGNAININAGTAKFSGTTTATALNLTGGTLALNGVGLGNVGTFTVTSGTLSTQNGATSATNLGNIVLNGIMNLAMDADLSGTGSADTFSATNVSGTGSININNIKILNDHTTGLPITIGVFSDNLKDNVTLGVTSVDGVAAGRSYSVTYTDSTGSLVFGYTSLYDAVKDTATSRSYVMAADETVTQNLGSMNGTTLTINGNNHSVNGGSYRGIVVGTNKELNINNIGSVTGSLAGGDLTVVDSWNGAYGYYSNEASVVLNSGGTVNISDSVFYNNSHRANGGAIFNNSNMNISGDTYFITNKSTDYSGGAIYNNTGSTLTIKNGADVLFYDNKAPKRDAGAVYNQGTFTVEEGAAVTFDSNTSRNGGSAIYQTGANAVVNLNGTSTSKIVFNNNSVDTTAGNGGAIRSVDAKELNVKYTEFTSNKANKGSGGSGISAGAIYASGNQKVTIENSTFTSNTAYSNAGAVMLNDVTLATISGSTFTSNTATNGNGGAVYVSGNTTLNVSDSTFTSNSQNAIYQTGANAVVNINGTSDKKVTFDSNETSNASKHGGAICAVNTKELNVTYADFTSNKANKGSSGTGSSAGAIYADNVNKVSIENATFTSNQTYKNGGAVALNDVATATIKKSTFTGNSTQSSGSGGALYVSGNTNLTIEDTNFTNNTSGSTGNGGAIYNAATTTIIANTDSVSFSGNKRNTTNNDIHNVGTLNLQAKESKNITFASPITDNSTKAGTTTIGGTYMDGTDEKTYSGTVNFNGSVTQKEIDINSGTAKFSGTVTATDLKLNGGTLALNGVGLNNVTTVTVADGTTLSTQNGATSATNLGNIVLNGVMNLAMDADLSGTGSADTFSATNVSGTGSININNIKILNDHTSGIPITIGVFSNNLKDKVTLGLSKVDGVTPGRSYSVTYTDSTGSLVFGYGSIYDAVKDTSTTRAYVMAADESIAIDLAEMGGTELSIVGNNHTLSNDNNHQGIIVSSGQTLNLTDLTVTNMTTGMTNNYGGELNITDSTFTGNGVDIHNEGSMNLKPTDGKSVTFDTVIEDNATTPTGVTTVNGAGTVNFNDSVTQKAINIVAGTVNIAASDLNTTDGVTNEGTLNLSAGTLGASNTITGTNGTVNFTDNVVNNAAISQKDVTVANGKTLTNNAAINATGTVTNNGTINSAAAISAGALANNGTVSISATNLNTNGVTNEGTLNLSAGTLGASNTITGTNGTVNFTDNVVNNAAISQKDVTVANGKTLTNNAAINATGTVTNNGAINSAAAISAGALANNGSITTTAGITTGALYNGTNSTITSSANITTAGGTNNGTVSTTGAFSNSGNFTNNSSVGAGTFTNSGNFVNDGSANSKISANNVTNNGTLSTSTDGIETPNDIVNNGTLKYTSGNKTTNNITGAPTGNVVLNTGDSLVIDNVISGTKLTLQDSTISFTPNGDISGASQLNINGGGIDVLDNALTNTNLGNVVMNNNTNLALDFNLSKMKSDTFTTTNLTTNGNKFNINDIKISGNTQKDHFTINLGDSTGLGTSNVTSNDITLPTIMTPIRKISGRLQDGMLTYGPAGNGWRDYNSAILAAPIAAQLGGYLTELNAYDEAFRNLDMKMLMTRRERTAYKLANRYAMAEKPQVYSPIYMKEADRAAWFRPYSTFEKVNLKNGPHVSNILYGAFFGGDSQMYELRHGWDFQYSGYVGYTGSHQAYVGNDIYQNGGLVGATALWYKGNYFAAITANVGASVADISTRYGSDDFVMLMSGVAVKTGYNWELAGGRFIIQPSYMMSYTLINGFDYTNSAGVKVDSKPLNAINIAPGIKLISNLKNGWQPYFSIQMVWNIMDKTNYYAANISLPEFSVKPYIQYGVGIQKQYGDRFTGYFQAMLRNGGRNGVALSAGLRYALGKTPESKMTPVKVIKVRRKKADANVKGDNAKKIDSKKEKQVSKKVKKNKNFVSQVKNESEKPSVNNVSTKSDKAMFNLNMNVPDIMKNNAL